MHTEKTTESAHVRLARETVEHYAREGKPWMPDYPLPEELTSSGAGVFVSLHKDGELRGCIGTIAPMQKDVAHEILHNAIGASSQDPRFSPVEVSELKSLEYHVDVLESPEPIDGEDELDPRIYGVIVTLGNRRGLLLPDLPGVDTAALQVSIAMRKAGIPPAKRPEVQLERFRVTRYS
jgi:AmmeMemoRadiSam system protein A